MKIKNIILIIILASLAIGIGLFQNRAPDQIVAKHGAHDIWYCPMHPHYTSDHPGHCPICGMDLVQMIEKAQPHESTVKDYTTISLGIPKQQLIGLRTAIVSKKSLIKTVRAAGQYAGEVFAQIFEDDLGFIKVGQKAIVELPAYHHKYAGIVKSIDSSIDEASRTIRVHIWLDHIDQRKFKSNMFANIEFPVELGRTIVIPRDAVMDTGMRKIVFVQKDTGTFEPREIQTGWETDDGFEVKSGLTAGERIVISGNFLLDSESRVQAGLQQGDTNG